MGLILAFMTRKVKIDPLNDSRYSAILIYIATLFLLGSLVIFFLVEDNNTYAAVWTTYVLAEVCVFLGLNFIPKVSDNVESWLTKKKQEFPIDRNCERGHYNASV